MKPVKVLVELPGDVSHDTIESIRVGVDRWVNSPESEGLIISGAKSITVITGGGPYSITEELNGYKVSLTTGTLWELHRLYFAFHGKPMKADKPDDHVTIGGEE